MSGDRSFSFGHNDDTSYQAYRGASGYQVSSGPSYLPHPDPSREDHSSSPLSSLSTPSPPTNGHGHSAVTPLDSYSNSPQQPQYQQRSGQQRVSGYRAQRQQDMPTRSVSSTPGRKPLPPAPQAEVSLDGHPHSIPLPPMHAASGYPNDPQLFAQDTAYSNSSPYQQARRGSSPPDEDLSYTSSRGGPPPQYDSSSSQLALAAAAATPALATPGYGDARSFAHERQPSPYRDNIGHPTSSNDPSQNTPRDPRQGLGSIDPMEIEDDDDDPFSSISRRKAAGAGLAGGAAAAGAGGFLKGLGSRDTSGSYGQVPGGSADKAEKRSDWLRQQTTGNKRLKWMVGGLIVLVIVLAVIGGVVGVLLQNKNASSSSDGDIPTSGDLNKNSPAIQALMNNPRLHKVFPGIDYSPLNAQYPACLTNPPLQNNITADIAVLSQLTPVVRLYGTDCEQTEMVLHAIKALGLQDQMKIWGGIYIGNNATTNARQTRQMYDVLDKYGADQFVGVIVGNEVLFNKWIPTTELISKMDDVRTTLQQKGMSSLRVSTSDLGSDWDAELTAATDDVMANVHPFFGGVAAPQAANWTYTFWQNNDVVLTAGTQKGNIIAETGWPSQGGNYCASEAGAEIKCSSGTQGAVAGISEMNLFLSEWVCTSLERKTNYFWFEAFDEPWKVIYNLPNEHWEPNWGLMDVNRNLKDGIVIPDCGGRTAQVP